MSESSRHSLANNVDELVRDFKVLRQFKRDSSTKYRQARKDLDDMMKTLDAQSKQDRESVERLWLRIPRLNAAKIQAHANDDLGLCNEIDEELKAIQIQVEELALGINSMERDITEISNLLTEQ
ncbi:hypothetical protein ACHAPC_006234 [Botrytis cinerea]|uniref:Uncharacterized protein n=1 Tax=Botryotinia fuckeliana (strain BcDW1) TaxID=1290391 RepID=M7UVX4_BOTF1|nr:hypothetical protein BcDW1_3365 [Botrytis cinerea BcDW1]